MYVLTEKHTNIEVLTSQTGFKVNNITVCPLEGAEKYFFNKIISSYCGCCFTPKSDSQKFFMCLHLITSGSFIDHC